MLNNRLSMLSNLRGNALLWGINLSAGSCFLLFGYDQVRDIQKDKLSLTGPDSVQQGVLGGLVGQQSFLDAIDNPNATYLGTIVSLKNM